MNTDKEDLIEKVTELLERMVKDVPSMVHKIQSTGVVEAHAHNGHNYKVPKMIVEAILRDRQDCYWPKASCTKQDRRDINNYICFL